MINHALKIVREKHNIMRQPTVNMQVDTAGGVRKQKFCSTGKSPAEASPRANRARAGLPWTPASWAHYRSLISRTLAPMLSKICVANIPPPTHFNAIKKGRFRQITPSPLFLIYTVSNSYIIILMIINSVPIIQNIKFIV